MAEIMPKLTRLERRKSDLLLTYESGDQLSVEYVDLRHACPCAKCAPNRNEDQTSIDLRESVEKLANKKPKVVTVGNYALSLNGRIKVVHQESIVLKESGLLPIIKTQIMENHTSMGRGEFLPAF